MTGSLMNIKLGKRLLFCFISGLLLTGQAQALDESCVVNILNRTIQVASDGGWSLPNVPSNQGRIRARATCVDSAGDTISGQSEYFNAVNNGIVRVGELAFDNTDKPPVALNFSLTSTIEFFNLSSNYQLSLSALYADGSVKDVTRSESGVNYSSTNPAVVTVDENGFVSATGNGFALISARKDGVLATRSILVSTGDDLDGDGIPDDYEAANGLNPNDPIDAFEDRDKDGLSALDEYNAGTNPNLADTDGDGIKDGEELVEGADGFITSPLLVDTDGDGLSDSAEIVVGSSPVDPDDTNFADAVVALTVTPDNVVMTFNTINTEVSTQLSVTGHVVDGTTLDLTSKASGTSYSSSDLSIVSFGLVDGEIFAGSAGSALVSIDYFNLSVDVPVEVESFEPVAISSLTFSGSGVATDVSGDYVYIAASTGGVHVVDVSDRSTPSIVNTIVTSASARDVRVLGNTAYIAVSNNGVEIYDVTDPTAPVLQSTIDTAGSAVDLFVDQQVLYVATGTDGLAIIDVANPLAPFTLSTLSDLGSVSGVAAENGKVVVVAGSAVIVINAEDSASPVRMGSINIGSVRDIEINGDYAYVAAYTSGYKVVDVSDPMLPRISGGESGFYPTDVALTNGFAFFAETLFVNASPFVNISDPENPIWQGIIDLRVFGDRDAQGLSVDSSYAYLTGSNYFYIGQYRLLNDNMGIAPTVSVSSNDWQSNLVVVEGKRLSLLAEANDDIAVAAVSFFVNDTLVFTDTTAPYQLPVTVPGGASSMTVHAQAVDLGGNVATSSTVTLTVEPDTDGDGLGDNEETVTYLTDPNNPDSDADGLSDGDEISRGTNPLASDSDGDGINDLDEINQGTDPLNPDITAPQVIAVDPIDASVDIAENTSITVTMDEELLAQSINSGSMVITEDTVPVSGSVSLINNGTQLMFTPATLLADYTAFVVTIDGVKDIAGNPLATPFISGFTTGNTVDTERPYIVDSSPVNNATNVPVNATISHIMNEAIDPTTVTESSFYVVDTLTGQRVSGITSVNEDKTVIEFVPDAAFPVGRRHYSYVSSGIKDLFGNLLRASYRYFTSSFDADVTGPEVSFISVSEAQANVPVNARLQVRFNEPVSPVSLPSISLLDGNGERVPVNRAISSNHLVVTITPKLPLNSNSGFSLVIDTVEDLSGNFLPTAITRSFSTGDITDTTQGTVTQFSPASNSTSVPVNTLIQLRLSEAVDSATLEPATFRLYDRTTGQFRDDVSYSVSADGRLVTMVPDSPLTLGRRYTAYWVYNTYPLDLAGNRFGSRSWSFTVNQAMDDTAPVQQLGSLLEGAIDVPVNTNLNIQFNESLDVTCVSSSTTEMSDGVNIIDGSVSLANENTLRFTPATALSTDTTYTLSVDGLCDYAGNILNGYSLSFTTGSNANADTTYPIVTVTPLTNSTDIDVNTDIVFSYNEPIDPTTLDTITVSVSGIGNIPGSFTVNADNTVATFTPDNPLPGGYRIDQYSWYVTDVAGNNTRTGYSTRFYTAEVSDNTAPTVSVISPSDGAMDVSIGTGIAMQFDEPLDPATVNSNFFTLFANGNQIGTSVSRSTDSRTVFLSGSLPANSIITVVATSGVRDLAGNNLVDYASVFTTTSANDTGRPSVSTFYPGNGSRNVATDRSIVLYFNESLDINTVESALRVSQNGGLIGGTVEIKAEGQVVEFTANQLFENDALIQVFMDSTATDIQGNALSPYSAYFNIVSGAATSLRLSAQSPSGTVNLANPSIDARFNKSLDVATVTTDNIYLWDNAKVDVTLSLVGDRTVHIQPNVPLVANKYYYIYYTTGLKALDGSSVPNTTYYYFYSGDTSNVDTQAPMVAGMSPPDGAIDVAVNSHRHIRFDEAMNVVSLQDYFADQAYSLSILNGNSEVNLVPHSPLLENTTLTDVVDTVFDVAGNVVVGDSSTYDTGTRVDRSAPVVVSSDPVANATAIPINSVFHTVFNEQIDPISIDSATTYLYEDITGAKIPGSLSLSGDGKTVSFVPDSALAVGRRYTMYVYPAKDLSGNARYHYAAATVGFDIDTTPPSIVSISVAEGQTDVPTNVRIKVRFDEPVKAMELSGIGLTDGITDVPFNTSFNADRTLLTLTPQVILQANSAYTITIDGIQDLTGNIMTTALPRSFVTGFGVDIVKGSVTQWSPATNSVLVPSNAHIQVRLNERVDPSSLEPATYRLYDITLGIFRDDVTYEVSPDGLVATMIPNALLEASHRYTAYWVYNTYPLDLANNRFNSRSFSFTVIADEDLAAPVQSSATINDATIGVQVNPVLKVSFNEPLDATCVNNSTVLLMNGLSMVEGSVSLANENTLRFTPATALSTDTTYTLSVDGLCDYAGNVLNGYSLSFTTGSNANADTTYPIVTVTPLTNSTDVDVNTDIVFSYNEPIDPTTLDTITVSVYGIGNIPGSFTVNADNTVATFTPDNPLPGGYRIDQYSWYVTDVAGNNTRSGYSTRFYTAEVTDNTAPTVSVISPSDGAMDVSVGTGIAMQFDEPLDPATVNSNFFTLFANGNQIGTSVSRSTDSRTVFLSGSLPANSIITVVATSGVRDLAGNNLVDYASVFTTTSANDTGRPSVSTFYPGNGSRNVATDRSIVLYFNESLDINTIEGALKVAQNGVLITGAVNISGDAGVVEFIPDQPFTGGALVQVFMDSTATDLQGNALNGYNAYFYTLSDTPTSLQLFTGTPSGTVNLASPSIDARFNKSLDVATVTTDNIYLWDNAKVDVTLSLVGDRTVHIQPNIPLVTNKYYYIYYTSGLKALDGSSVPNTSYYYFYSGDTSNEDTQTPMLAAVSPPDGTVDAAINIRKSFSFDEAMNVASLHEQFSTDGASLSITEGDKLATLTPHVPLPENSTISDTVDSVYDRSGNLVVTQSNSFMTGTAIDRSAPSVVSNDPVANATNVSTSAVFHVNYNEQLDPVSVNSSSCYLYDTTNGAHIAGSLSLSADGKTVSFVPDEALVAGRRYIFYAYPVRDLSGNNRYHSYSVTMGVTEDTVAPVVTSMSLSAGQTGVPTNARMRVVFNEPVKANSLSGLTLTDGVTSVPLSTSFNSDRTILTITPLQILSALTGYTLTVEDVEDLSSNVLAVPFVRSFVTGAGVDIVRGSVSQYSPVNNSTVVPVNAQIQLRLNERVDPTTLDTTTLRLYDNSTGQFRDDVTYDVSADGLVVTMIPDALLEDAHRYTVYWVYNTYPLDLANNRFNSRSWSFTVNNAEDTISPVILQTSLVDGQTDVSLNTRFLIQFDEAVNLVSLANIELLDSNNFPVAYNIAISADERIATITLPQNLNSSSDYSIVITGIEDHANNALQFDTTVNITTGSLVDTTRGNIVSLSPAANEINVPVGENVVLQLDEPVDRITIDDLSFRLYDRTTGLFLDASRTVSSDGLTMTLDPDLFLISGRSYSVYTSYYKSMYDLSGNIFNGRATSFTTQ